MPDLDASLVSAVPPYTKRYEAVLLDDDADRPSLAGVIWVGLTGFPEPERRWTWDAIPSTTEWRFDAGLSATMEDARDAATARVRAMVLGDA